MRVVISLFAAGFLAVAVMPAQAVQLDQVECGKLQNVVGPFDYREALDARRGGKLSHPGAAALIGIEERYLNEDVVTLRDPRANHAIDTTLRAFPNHHKALWAAVRNEGRSGPPKIGDPVRLSVKCYIQRALTAAADDGLVWMLWGVHLHKNKEYRDAIVKYKRALELDVESAELHYNLGLALLKIEDLRGAVEQARLAYARNYPLQALKRKLIKRGVWEN